MEVLGKEGKGQEGRRVEERMNVILTFLTLPVETSKSHNVVH